MKKALIVGAVAGLGTFLVSQTFVNRTNLPANLAVGGAALAFAALAARFL